MSEYNFKLDNKFSMTATHAFFFSDQRADFGSGTGGGVPGAEGAGGLTPTRGVPGQGDDDGWLAVAVAVIVLGNTGRPSPIIRGEVNRISGLLGT